MNIGIIGTGWGLMHLGAFRAAGAEVSALCGRDEQKTRRIAEREHVAFATSDVGALCERVDAVVVAGPDALHLEHARAALERGRPVLCEKPLARTERDANELAAIARRSGVPCAINFPYRMLPPFVALHRWLGEGRVLRELVVTVRNGFAGAEGDRADGPRVGASGDFGGASHVVDAALWLSRSTPIWVQAALRGRPVSTAALHVGLASGAVAVITHAACPERGIHGAWSLLGDEWEAGLGAGFVPARGGWCVSAPRALEHDRWADVAPGVEPAHGEPEPWARAHVETARAFLSAISGGPRPERLATFDDGARVQRVLSAACRSDEEGRRVAIDPP